MSGMTLTVREAAVAGRFYPEDAAELRLQLHDFLTEAATQHGDEPAPKVLVAPHAGTVYSGPIAASGYVRLRQRANDIRRVVLLGPAHRVAVRGVAASSARQFRTPLGAVDVDTSAVAGLLEMADVAVNDEAHRQEHSLEVHLPFLQSVLKEVVVLPLVVGEASPEVVAAVLDACWGGSETVIIISTDLSHFHEYETARTVDRQTSEMFEQLRYQELTGERACGVHPMSGLMLALQRRGMRLRTIDLRNSGDTAGSRREVVGYGAYVTE